MTDLCRSCGRPFSPTHDVDVPGPTSRHPFLVARPQEEAVSPRTITFELPPEPPMNAVVLVDAETSWRVDGKLVTERVALQRRQESSPSAWHMVGRDPAARPLDWHAVLSLAGGRPILVLWEPAEEVGA